MPVHVKLDLKSLTDLEFVAREKAIVTAMTGNTNFTSPTPPLADLTTNAYFLGILIADRDALLSQAQTKTVAIRAMRNAGEGLLNSEANYVADKANASVDPLNPPEEIVTSADMTVAATPSPVGPMPKVEGLHATTLVKAGPATPAS